jgi:hypothetical protein
MGVVRYSLRSIGALCAILAAAVAYSTAAQAKRVALVIGNSAYEHTRVLPNARSDARLIAELLYKIGFEVTEAGDMAYRPMRDAIRAFGAAAQGAEMALVYYAGHGMEVAGENWLLPVSAALRHERDLEYEAVGLSSILAAVKGAGRLKLIILDACRNNPLGERVALSSAATRSVLRGLARVEPSGDILVVYSAKHGTLAEDGPSGGNSPFAAALAANIATPGLDVRIMFGKVRDAVKATTGGRQEPFTYGSVGGETIALHSGGAQDIAPKLPRPVVALPPQTLAKPTNSTSGKASYWRSEVGSVLELQDSAGAVTIRYLEVGGLAAKMGITPGTIIFRGQRNAQEFVGVATAFFDGGCRPTYPMRVAIEDGGKKLTTYADAPTSVDQSCRVLQTGKRSFTWEHTIYRKQPG